MSDVAEYPEIMPIARAPLPALKIFAPATSAKARTAASCSACAMHAFCMPQGLTHAETDRMESLISPSRTIRSGESLYRANDSFQSIYAVRAGSFKTVVMHRDGREQVTGFSLAGNVMGLDGVCSGRHSCDALAIEDSKVCIIPFHLLETMCREVKTLQQHVHRLLGGEIVREATLMMLLGTMSADQRVAAFLLNLSSRLKTRGYSPAEFHLRMTREEIGSYLGMKLETVSRMFSKFQKDGLVDTHGKQIRILDMEGLARV
ncbi:helix-turn-helix domain-containing protein [Paraburkholderia sp. RL17-373-BIF-A]|uniref:helix-turn-helix domain-containing protein n=1 Tax=Paraburkholderia sp. RL17-373-BIF-A TaxID=3031629 RepID=UPI0038B9E955